MKSRNLIGDAAIQKDRLDYEGILDFNQVELTFTPITYEMISLVKLSLVKVFSFLELFPIYEISRDFDIMIMHEIPVARAFILL